MCVFVLVCACMRVCVCVCLCVHARVCVGMCAIVCDIVRLQTSTDTDKNPSLLLYDYYIYKTKRQVKQQPVRVKCPHSKQERKWHLPPNLRTTSTIGQGHMTCMNCKARHWLSPCSFQRPCTDGI